MVFSKSTVIKGLGVLVMCFLISSFSYQKEDSTQQAGQTQSETEMLPADIVEPLEQEKPAVSEISTVQKKRVELQKELENLISNLDLKEKQLAEKETELQAREREITAKETQLVRRERNAKTWRVISILIFIIGMLFIVAALITLAKAKRMQKSAAVETSKKEEKITEKVKKLREKSKSKRARDAEKPQEVTAELKVVEEPQEETVELKAAEEEKSEPVEKEEIATA